MAKVIMIPSQIYFTGFPLKHPTLEKLSLCKELQNALAKYMVSAPRVNIIFEKEALKFKNYSFGTISVTMKNVVQQVKSANMQPN